MLLAEKKPGGARAHDLELSLEKAKYPKCAVVTGNRATAVSVLVTAECLPVSQPLQDPRDFTDGHLEPGCVMASTSQAIERNPVPL